VFMPRELAQIKRRVMQNRTILYKSLSLRFLNLYYLRSRKGYVINFILGCVPKMREKGTFAEPPLMSQPDRKGEAMCEVAGLMKTNVSSFFLCAATVMVLSCGTALAQSGAGGGGGASGGGAGASGSTGSGTGANVSGTGNANGGMNTPGTTSPSGGQQGSGSNPNGGANGSSSATGMPGNGASGSGASTNSGM
jgi:hypothetical protein